MSSLFSLIPPGEEEVSLDVLEDAVAAEDVLVDCLTDEELYWLRSSTWEPDPTMDEPYLSTLGDDARSVAIDCGLRSLIAKGMVDLDPDQPENMEIVGPYALIGMMRGSAEAVTRIRLDAHDQPPMRIAYFRVSPALVLCEEVSDDGFHDFVLQAPDAAAAAMASMLDRSRRAGDVSESWARTDDRRDLAGRVEDLAGRARHTVLVVSAGLDATGRPYERLLTVYGLDDGVWAFWGVSDGPDEEFVLGRFGAADLYGLSEGLIIGRPQ